MTTKRPMGLFITGTNTGVGKTFIAAAVASHLNGLGVRVGVYKPVLSGATCELNCKVDPASIPVDCPDDDVVLWRAAGCPGDLIRVCPQRFRAPVAPHRAAALEGKKVDSELLRTGFDYWAARSEFIIVEGAGGFFSPVSEADVVADLAVELELALLIVAKNELGVINQVLQAILAAQTYRGGVPVAGIVLNDQGQTTGDLSLSLNLADITLRCDVPRVIATSKYEADQIKAVDWLNLQPTHRAFRLTRP